MNDCRKECIVVKTGYVEKRRDYNVFSTMNTGNDGLCGTDELLRRSPHP